MCVLSLLSVPAILITLKELSGFNRRLYMILSRVLTVFICLLTICVQTAVAQSDKQFKQPAHVLPQNLSWWDSIYLFPSFLDSHLVFATGFSPEQTVSLNYNMYTAQMDMINSNGDTLQIEPPKAMKSLLLGSNQFYYDPQRGYLEVILPGKVKLASRTFLMLDKVDEGRAFSSQEDYRGRALDFDTYYRRVSTFFFIDESDQIRSASHASIRKMLPDHKKSVSKYVRDESINFERKTDLVKLIEHCNYLVGAVDAHGNVDRQQSWAQSY